MYNAILRQVIRVIATLLLGTSLALGQAAGLPAGKTPIETAVGHIQAGRLQAAEAILVKLIQGGSNDVRVYETLAYVYNLKSEPARALVYWQRSIKIRPSAAAHAGLAATLAELGREQDAETNFRKALSIEPGNLLASYNLAGLFLRREDFEQAAPLLERVVKAAPGQAEPTYLLALCHSGRGKPEQAQAVLLTLPAKARDREPIQLLLGSIALTLKKPEEARKYFERVLQLNPGSVQGAANLGALLSAGAESQQGIELLEQAWRSDKTSYLAGYNLALAYKQTGKPEQARGVLATLLTKGETGEIYNLLGSIEAALKNPKDAVGYLERAVELDPRESHFFDLGHQQLLNYSLKEAQATFQRGVQRYPEAARLWMGLGTAYFAQARNEEAVTAYLRAAEKNDDPQVLRFLGNAYLTLNNPRDDVASRFRRYRQTHPDDAWANFYEGYNLSRAGDAEQALPLLQKAVRIDAKLAEAHLELGNVMSRQGRADEAVAAYQAAIAANPQYQQAYYRLGQTLMKAGRQAEAEAALKKHEELRAQEAAGLEARMLSVIRSLEGK